MRHSKTIMYVVKIKSFIFTFTPYNILDNNAVSMIADRAPIYILEKSTMFPHEKITT